MSNALVEQSDQNEQEPRKKSGRPKGSPAMGGTPSKDLIFDDPNNVKKLHELASNCLTVEQICGCFSISRATFYKILELRPHLKELMVQAKQNTINDVAKSLIKEAKRGGTAERIFFLKAQAGWKDKIEVVHSGTVQQEIQIEVVKRIDQMTPEQREARLQELKLLKEMDTEVIDVEVD